MRYKRNKIKGKGCYYHVSNHVSGIRGVLPFDSEDKEMGFLIIEKLKELFYVEVVSMCWMGNHFHMVIFVPGTIPSLEEAVYRYNEFYKNDPYHHPCLDLKKEPDRSKKIVEKLIDLSEFMRSFQQRYTCWYNKKANRQGPLWKSRFWSCILEGSTALWECVKYVELNPVRANIVDNPEDYVFSTWGKGVDNPFKNSFVKHMRSNSGFRQSAFIKLETEKDFYEQFRYELQNILTIEQRMLKREPDALHKESRQINEGLFSKFLVTVKDWSAGMIIGSQSFVEQTALDFFQKDFVVKKKKIYGSTHLGLPICAFHKGRCYVPG